MPRIHRLVFLLCLTALGTLLPAQQKVWIFFRDKGPEQAEWANDPGKYLSAKALERRAAVGNTPNAFDGPVSLTYQRQLQAAGIKVHGTSRWINAVSALTDKSLAELQAICPAVAATQPVAKFTASRYTDALTKVGGTADTLSYGESQFQIDQLNLQCLHLQGKTGSNVLIAVFDSGFLNADTISAFDSLWQQGRLVTYYDFVNQDTTVFDEHNHGMNVMSTIIANLPGEMVGSAPHAKIALARTEDVGSETNQEEDNWMMAVEWADSLGADLIQSSLGYTTFDVGQVSYTYADLDGNTTIVSRAADLAASRGILVVNSAGNEGSNPWHHISAPCDADSILCVGAVDFLNGSASFSGVGPSADGQVKPDVCALGVFTAVIGNNGEVAHSSGTSFSAPLMAGFAACLRGAHPLRSNMEVIRAIRESSSQFSNPDTLLGYGIPDACKADSILTVWDSLGVSSPAPVAVVQPIAVFPNPTGDVLVLENNLPANPITGVQVMTVDGKVVMEMGRNALGNSSRSQLQVKGLPAGTYILRMTLQNGKVQATRFIRN
ncbi:MAG TPA: S8 family peptidase [Bacteroidia bacterium]|nr:S8 family peptidase [Bacteroidia bacterium]